MKLINRDKQVVFSAGSGRSGTTTLIKFIQHHVPDCTALHEPNLRLHGIRKYLCRLQLPKGSTPLEARGFGQAIDWYDGYTAQYKQLIDYRAHTIKLLPGSIYFEANHAFLKSLCDGMASSFPSMRLVYLCRHPFEVSRSLCNRHSDLSGPEFISRFNNWNIRPGLQRNVLPIPSKDMSGFQLYLWAWIELELRYVRFKEQHPDIPVFELEIAQFNDRNSMWKLLEFLGVRIPESEVILAGRNNTNLRTTVVTEEDIEEGIALLRIIPEEYLYRLTSPYNLLELKAT